MFKYIVNGNEKTGYGIDVYKKGTYIGNIPSVFSKEKDAEEFVCLCNRLNLSPIHLENVIYDILGSKNVSGNGTLRE